MRLRGLGASGLQDTGLQWQKKMSQAFDWRTGTVAGGNKVRRQPADVEQMISWKSVRVPQARIDPVPASIRLLHTLIPPGLTLQLVDLSFHGRAMLQ